MELPVSVPRPTAPKFAATAAAVPPLEPAVTRSSAYGLRVYPGSSEFTVSIGSKANSAMLFLASMMAPASRSFLIWKASVFDITPLSESDPAAVGMSVVSVSFTISGTQCSGPTGPVCANLASRASATFRASGFVTTIARVDVGDRRLLRPEQVEGLRVDSECEEKTDQRNRQVSSSVNSEVSSGA
jgi:hypothetical protein